MELMWLKCNVWVYTFKTTKLPLWRDDGITINLKVSPVENAFVSAYTRPLLLSVRFKAETHTAEEN